MQRWYSEESRFGMQLYILKNVPDASLRLFFFCGEATEMGIHAHGIKEKNMQVACQNQATLLLLPHQLAVWKKTSRTGCCFPLIIFPNPCYATRRLPWAMNLPPIKESHTQRRRQCTCTFSHAWKGAPSYEHANPALMQIAASQDPLTHQRNFPHKSSRWHGVSPSSPPLGTFNSFALLAVEGGEVGRFHGQGDFWLIGAGLWRSPTPPSRAPPFSHRGPTP